MAEPINLLEFEEIAAKQLPLMVFDYYAAGAHDGITRRANRTSFNQLMLRPRMLRDVSQRDWGIKLWGIERPTPLIIAPMALTKMAHPDGELGIVRAVNELGIMMCLSTMSTTSLEEVQAAASLPMWFQLYVYRDKEITRALVQRAEAAGYEALVVTVDTPYIGRREADIRNQFHLPDGIEFANFSGDILARLPVKQGDSGFNAYIASQWNSALTWHDIDWLRSITTMKVLVKGILRGDDAKLAIEHGVDGIVVSNHGGRQLDTAIATIAALPEIAKAVDGQTAIILDGGVRRGTDILKALALGATAVSVGRPALWGLAYNGQAGVHRVCELLLAEFDNAMALAGCRNVAEITRDLIV